MATKTKFSISLVARDGSDLKQCSISGDETLAGDFALANVQAVGIADEALVVGDVPANGYLALINLDTTNFVQVDSASTYDKFPQKVYPGEGILLRPQTATIHVKADTAPVNISYLIVGPKA